MVKSPLVVQDYLCPIESTRKKLMEENSSRSNHKKFCFKKYVTEKERIKKYLEERKSFGEYYDERGNFIQIQNSPPKKKKKEAPIYEQPKMRFKPRTDLERIVDSINEYNFNKINSDLVRKQLKILDLNYMKKKILKENQSNLSSSISETSSSYDEIRVKPETKTNNNSTDNKSMKSASQSNFYKSKRVLIDNSVAKQLMQEYHYKTHFKAASTLAEKFTDERTKQKQKEIEQRERYLFRNSCINFNRSYSNMRKNKTYDIQSVNNSVNHYDSILNKFAKKFPLIEENFDLVQANPLLYNLNFHQMKSATRESVNEEDSLADFEQKLNYLKNLSNNNNSNNVSNQSEGDIKVLNKKKVKFQERNIYKPKKNDDDDIATVDLNKEDRIRVNNEIIPLSQIDLIANRILKNCNYVHCKNANNNRSLKKGDGKLMITSGMTINDFMRKYQLE